MQVEASRLLGEDRALAKEIINETRLSALREFKRKFRQLLRAEKAFFGKDGFVCRRGLSLDG